MVSAQISTQSVDHLSHEQIYSPEPLTISETIKQTGNKALENSSKTAFASNSDFNN
jgi:hypothetical protein